MRGRRRGPGGLPAPEGLGGGQSEGRRRGRGVVDPYVAHRAETSEGSVSLRPLSDTPQAVPWVRYRSAAGKWVLLATVLGSGMAFLDATVVNIALPTIGEDFDARALQPAVDGQRLHADPGRLPAARAAPWATTTAGAGSS